MQFGDVSKVVIPQFKVGDIIKTINGVGIIKDIRYQGDNPKEPVYLICTDSTGESVFGGDSDIYCESEFESVKVNHA